VTCDAAREAVSALLDGEAVEIGPEELERHLRTCTACFEWREDAHEVTRRARIGVAAPTADVDGPLLAAVLAARPHTSRWRAGELTRVALVAVALLQIVLAVPVLVGGSLHHASIHLAHELGSFDIALAVGFLIAAWRPEYARGMRTIVGVAALLLLLTTVVDSIVGDTSLGGETRDLLAVVGWLLLWRLSAEAPWINPRSTDSRLRAVEHAQEGPTMAAQRR
jgi:predicted anti-sigma-YlaC factor YlaD